MRVQGCGADACGGEVGAPCAINLCGADACLADFLPCALKLTADQGPDDGNGVTPSHPGQNCSEDGDSCSMDLDSSVFCPTLDKINPRFEVKPGRTGTIDPKRPGRICSVGVVTFREGYRGTVIHSNTRR